MRGFFKELAIFACFVPSVGVVLQMALERDPLEEKDDKVKNKVKKNNYDNEDTFICNPPFRT